MPDPALAAALASLSSEHVEEIQAAIRRLAERLPDAEGADLRAAVEGLCGLFYVDTQDRPDLEASLDLAVETVASCGPRVVPQLLELLEGSDIKCHLHIARTLGRIGPAALPALRRTIATREDPYTRSFALFAVGKVKGAAVKEALPEVLGSLLHPDREVRDSAARALGKIAEAVPAAEVSEVRRQDMFEGLVRALGDPQPPVRAKAIRSLGKLVREGYLAPAEVDRVGAVARRLLGEDEAHEWDRAYIVRREAKEALAHVAGHASRVSS
jgi:HEAT repeat protein